LGTFFIPGGGPLQESSILAKANTNEFYVGFTTKQFHRQNVFRIVSTYICTMQRGDVGASNFLNNVLKNLRFFFAIGILLLKKKTFLIMHKKVL
jgi:hypothetical protein